MPTLSWPVSEQCLTVDWQHSVIKVAAMNELKVCALALQLPARCTRVLRFDDGFQCSPCFFLCWAAVGL